MNIFDWLTGVLNFPGAAVFDCDNDGLSDIVFARQANECFLLYKNMGNFNFEEIGLFHLDDDHRIDKLAKLKTTLKKV